MKLNAIVDRDMKVLDFADNNDLVDCTQSCEPTGTIWVDINKVKFDRYTLFTRAEGAESRIRLRSSFITRAEGAESRFRLRSFFIFIFIFIFSSCRER